MMKTRRLILSILFLLLICGAFSLFSCGIVTSNFEIVFKVNGETYQTVSTDGQGMITLPRDPALEGYTFDGWYWDEGSWSNPFTADAHISSDVSVYAKFSAISYDITYENGAGIHSNATSYTVEDEIVLSAAEKRGYSFAGWYSDPAYTNRVECIRAGSTGAVTLYAKFDVENYTISYENVKGAENKNVTCYNVNTETISLLPLSKPGYTFEGWYHGEEKVTTIQLGSTGNRILTAKWSVDCNSITYHNTEGAVNGNPVGYDVENLPLELLDASKNGYTFLGWYTEATFENKVTGIAVGTVGDLHLYAKWETVEYTATFKNGDAVIAEIPFTIESGSITAPAVPERTGYTGAWESYTLAAGNVTVNTVYTAIEYTATFKNGDTVIAEIPFTVESGSITAPAVPERTGYTGAWESYTLGASDITVLVQWTANPDTEYTVNHYQQNVDNDGYTLYSTQKLSGTSDGPVTPAVNGYIGFTAPALQTITIKPDGSSVVNYYYTRNYYTVTVVGNGGTCTVITQKYGSPIDTTDWTEREGYTLAGLYVDACMTVPYEDAFMSAGHKTVYAYWQGDTISSCFIYTSTGNSITIQGYVGGYASVRIPLQIGGLPVTAIAADAFRNNRKIVALEIPESVTDIGVRALAGCINLASIIVDDGNTTYDSVNHCLIETESKTLIAGCKNSVICDDGSITSIGDYAFLDTVGLISITIPASITSIGKDAFLNCYKLVEVIDNTEHLTITRNTTEHGCVGLYAMDVHCGESDIVNQNGYLFGTYFGSDYLLGYVGSDISLTLPADYNGQIYSIYQFAFYGREGLTAVTIARNVVHIGQYAFSGCSGLLSLNFVDGSEFLDIGVYAFSDCSGLTSVSLPSSVTSIELGAFSGCSNLESITVPFVGLWESDCASSSALFGYIFGNESYAGGTEIVQYYTAYKYEIYYIPATLKNVTVLRGNLCYGAFYNCATLTSVTIGNGVTSVGEKAFFNCTGLTCAELPESITSVGQGAFSGCSNLESITVPFVGSSQTQAQASGATLFGYIFGTQSYMGSTATTQFYASNQYVIYYIPNSLRHVTVMRGGISYGAFYNCSGLTSITIGNSVTSIGNSAFFDCTGLVEIRFNATAVSDLSSSNHAFYHAGKNNTGLTVYIGANVTKIPAYLFDSPYQSYECWITSVVFAQGSMCESIGACAFRYCTSLTSISIPSSVKDVGEEAFRYCKTLTSITIGTGVVSIRDSAFRDCYDLVEINFNATNAGSLGYNNFVFCSAGKNGNGITINIGAQVRSIPAYLFYPCADTSYAPNVTSVVFARGSQLEGIGEYAFEGCTRLRGVYITDLAWWLAVDFSSSTSNPLYYAHNLYLNGTLVTEIVIPDGSASIGDYSALNGCTSLRGVYITDLTSWLTAEFVGESPLYYARNLYLNNVLVTELTISEGITSIGKGPLSYCESLTHVTLPSSLISIGDWALYGCVNLRSISIPEGVTSIGIYALGGCASLTDVTLPSSLTSIGQGAFSQCTALKSILIPGGVSSIGSSAFAACTGLESITLPFVGSSATATQASARTLFGYIFGTSSCAGCTPTKQYYGSTNYETFYIPNSLKSVTVTGGSIFYGAFRNCSGLTSITLPSGITSIGDQAFMGCTRLTNITIPSLVKSIGFSAFQDCTSLTDITIPTSVTSIEKRAFAGCTKLSSVVFKYCTNWQYSSSSTATSGNSISSYELVYPSTAATYLKSTYCDYYWKCVR